VGAIHQLDEVKNKASIIDENSGPMQIEEFTLLTFPKMDS
jgi:hypothetical protein